MLDPFPFEFSCASRGKFAELDTYIKGQRDWFHSFHFAGGLTSPGRDPSAKKLHHLCLPPKLDGLSVLDVGAYEGFFSFAAESRGAARVVAADDFVWRLPGCTALANYEAVHRALGSRAERVTVPVERMAETIKEQFDIVLFLGVLYHAPNMVQYLENIAAVTKTMCVVETFMDVLDQERAGAAFYQSGEINNDASNWWGPNFLAVAGMLERVGFKHVRFQNLWDLNTLNQIQGKPIWGPVRTGRAVFHAYK